MVSVRGFFVRAGGGGAAPALSCGRHRRHRRRGLLLRQGHLIVELAPPGGVLGALGWAALAAETPLAGLAAPAAERARRAAVAGPLHPGAVVAALAEDELGLLLLGGLPLSPRALLFVRWAEKGKDGMGWDGMR